MGLFTDTVLFHLAHKEGGPKSDTTFFDCWYL